MEGLLLAQLLEKLGPLPAERGQWRFPDHDTFVLPVGDGSLWLHPVPPQPHLELREGRSPAGGRPSAFQQLLRARAGGTLLQAEQLKLDRVVILTFAGSEGFVSSPPVRLSVELTGRNANLVLLGEEGTIIGVLREVTADRNRYRQLLPGLPYVPPPPYERTDPRTLGSEEAARLLLGKPLSQLPQTLDGFGPLLLRALAGSAGLDPAETVTEDVLPRVADALGAVLADPAAAVAATADLPLPREQRRLEERRQLEARLRRELEARLRLVRRRLSDTVHLKEAAGRAAELRSQAELLLAFRPAAEPGAVVQLQDFEGRETTIRLEPGLDAVATAEVLFGRARRHERRFETAEQLRPGLEQEAADLEEELAGIGSLGLPELKERTAETVPEDRGRHRTQPGIRVQGPHGFQILIGRNARDNDRVTFGLARSRDVWLHVQGYRGSHVVIRAENREVPCETVLLAAQLAAGHSQAAAAENVHVDWTLRKNVWRPRGEAAGAVHFTVEKTVYVTPVRHGASEQGAQG